RIQPGAGFAGEPHPMQGRGVAERAIAAEELGARAGHRSRWFVDVEERHTVRELAVVGVARIESAIPGIDLGRHVHRGLCADVPKNPLDVTDDGYLSHAARVVMHLQTKKLDRGI